MVSARKRSASARVGGKCAVCNSCKRACGKAMVFARMPFCFSFRGPPLCFSAITFCTTGLPNDNSKKVMLDKGPPPHLNTDGRVPAYPQGVRQSELRHRWPSPCETLCAVFADPAQRLGVNSLRYYLAVQDPKPGSPVNIFPTWMPHAAREELLWRDQGPHHLVPPSVQYVLVDVQPPPRRSSILLFPSPAPPPRCPPPPPLRQPPPSPPQKASNGSCLPANMSGHTRRNTAKNVLRLQLAAGSEFGEMHKRPRPVESLLLVLEKVLPQCIPLYACRGLSHRGSKRLSMLYKHNTISIILYPFLYHPHQHGYSTFQGFTTCYTRPEHSL